MKQHNRISPLTLELYYRGLTTRTENKRVEKAFETDIETLKRYEALKESDREIQRLITNELARLNLPEPPAVTISPQKRPVWVIAAAAVLVCALVTGIFYLKINSPNNVNSIADVTDVTNKTDVTDITDVINVTDDKSTIITAADNPPAPDQPVISEKKPEKVTLPAPEKPDRDQPRVIVPDERIEIAAIPEPDTGVRLRGGNHTENQPAAIPEQPSNISIPPGISVIFENMFADRELTFVIIPARITAIRKNAFQGNPLLSVTIGSDVSIERDAIPGNFAAVYNAGGKSAGTYTRPDIHSEAWEKK